MKVFSEANWTGSERVCDKCFKKVDADSDDDENSVCTLCKKRYEGEFVECDKCSQWHCAPCSGFSVA